MLHFPGQTSAESIARNTTPIQPSPQATSRMRLFFLDHLRVALTILLIVHHLAPIYAGIRLYYYEFPDINDQLSPFILILAYMREVLQSIGKELAEAGYLENGEDIFFLTLQEVHTALERGEDMRNLVHERRANYEHELKRRHVPRVLLSDGTEPTPATTDGAEHQGTLQGTPASPGNVTGRARVILDPTGAHLEPGEILVAPFNRSRLDTTLPDRWRPSNGNGRRYIPWRSRGSRVRYPGSRGGERSNRAYHYRSADHCRWKYWQDHHCRDNIIEGLRRKKR
jgi:hypothetical protein